MEQQLYSMDDTELKELQAKSLEVLMYFKKICDANGLLFYLCGGACIGAIRHRGFIPWDDDIDVFMPREDYERLAAVWNEAADASKYSYCRTDEKVYTRLQLAAVGDENTTFIKARQADLDLPHTVRIDILPLDGCPNSRIKRKIQIFWALIHSMFIVGEPHTSKGRLLEGISKALLGCVRGKKARYRVWNYAKRKMTKYRFDECDKVTELCSWYQYMVNEYPRKAFDSAELVPFEDTTVPVPVGYDCYLSMAFGNYMTMPPKSQRYAKHDIVYMNLNEGYKQYKGIYYCTDK